MTNSERLLEVLEHYVGHDRAVRLVFGFSSDLLDDFANQTCPRCETFMPWGEYFSREDLLEWIARLMPDDKVSCGCGWSGTLGESIIVYAGRQTGKDNFEVDGVPGCPKCKKEL